jgi:hAT family C-terminal dimerisation region
MRSIVQTSKEGSCASIGLPTGTHSLSKKKQKRFGAHFEFGNISDEYDSSEEEVPDRYVSMWLGLAKIKIKRNSLPFRREQMNTFPLLSSLARCLHSILATTVSIERFFSDEEQIVTERRPNVSVSQVDSILIVRAVPLNSEIL